MESKQEIRKREIREREIPEREIQTREVREQTLQEQEIPMQEVPEREIREREIQTREVRERNEQEPEGQAREVRERNDQESEVQAREVQERKVQERKVQEREVPERDDQEREVRERLLDAWIAMAVEIRGNRFLTDFSLNEMLICNLLCRQRNSGGPEITATALCARMHLLKSQMNSILTGMERRGLIRRFRNPRNKRSVSIELREEALPLYLKEHEAILSVTESVRAKLGSEQTQTLTALLEQAAAIAAETQTKRSL